MDKWIISIHIVITRIKTYLIYPFSIPGEYNRVSE